MIPPSPTPPVCCATWQRTPNHEAGAGTRPAEWCITGLAFDEEVLVTILACSYSEHQGEACRLAWQTYNVHRVAQDPLVPRAQPKGGLV